MPSYPYTWKTSDFSMEVGETITITLNWKNRDQSIPIFEDSVQIGTTTTNTYEYTPTSAGTHTLHYFNTIECSPLTVTVTGGSIVSNNDTTTLNGALTELGETIADNLTTMGVTDVDANDGLTTLARKILDIEQSGNEQEIVSFDNLTTEFNYTRKRGSDGFSVTIPSGITSLGVACFNGCTGLTNVIIPSGVTNLRNYCFGDCTSLTSVTIPNSVTSLGNDCFRNCYNLTNVTIPNSVTSLGDYCFYACGGLTNVTIPSSVTSLGRDCFDSCFGLTSVTIPSSVTSIGMSCFYDCTELVDYQLYWETPPVTWNSSLMPNNTDTYFTIPNGTTANYTAKGFPSDKLIERSE